MVFGNDGRLESGSNFSRLKTKINNNNNNNNNTNSSSSNNSAPNLNNNNSTNSNNNNSSSSSSENLKTLLDILKSTSQSINKNDLINALKYSTRAEINNVISSLLNDQNESTSSSSTNLPANSSNASLTSLVSNSTLNNNNNNNEGNNNNLNINNNNNNDTLVNSYDSNKSEDMGADNEQPADSVGMSKLNLQSSENFDEHIASNVEFDDSDTQSIQKQGNEFDAEYEGDDEVLAKNDLSLFNELSRENYDITELDDGADLTGILIFWF